MKIDLLSRYADWLVQPAGDDPERQFRAELGAAFGSLQLAAVLLLGSAEYLWGTPAIGTIFMTSAVLMLSIMLWLRLGGKPANTNIAMLTVLFATAAVVNVGTGGAAIGPNVALPTFALLAVLMSTPRMGVFWIVLIVLQVWVVSYLRALDLHFPIQPDPRWVETALDRVPIVFSLLSALIGWLIRRALLRFRVSLQTAHGAERTARAQTRALAERFEDFAQVAADGFWETDAELRLTYVSDSFARMIGLRPEQFLGLRPDQAYRLRFPDAKGVDEFIKPLLDHVSFVDQLLTSQTEQGARRWLLSQGRLVQNEDGAFAGYRGAVRDVTVEHLARKALRESERRLRSITDNLPVLISYIDSDQVFRFNNALYSDWLEMPLDRITGKRLTEVFSAETYALIQPNLERALSGERTVFEIPPGEDRNRHIQVNYVPDVDATGRVLGVYGLTHDITKMREAEAELRRLSEFDTLTGLANRKRLADKLTEAIARSERNGQALALLFLDLDEFKSVNDTLGHKGGDMVLQEFARRLIRSVRQTDTVARLAGDEFVIVAEMLHTPDEANRIAEKILEAMVPNFSIFGQQRKQSTSIGVVVKKPGETDADSLLRRADHALYEAKAAGGSNFRGTE